MNFVQDLCEDLYELFKVNKFSVLIITENEILEYKRVFSAELICTLLLVSLAAVELTQNRGGSWEHSLWGRTHWERRLQ